MEVTAHNAAVEMDHASRVSQARRLAERFASDLDFDETGRGRAALIVTELGKNLVKHARRGWLLLGALPRSREAPAELEVVAYDSGPGMGDVEACLRDGYSTSGTPGTGLGAVRRLADELEVVSSRPQGTVIVARLRAAAVAGAPPANRWGAFAVGGTQLPLPGESVCGDGWTAFASGGALRVLLVDGLGHGPEAAAASTLALRVAGERPGLALDDVLEHVHEALRSTRGAAALLVELDPVACRVRWAGLGNVAGAIVDRQTRTSVFCQDGTLGHYWRSVRPLELPWAPEAMLVLHTDGLASGWSLPWPVAAARRDPTLVAAALMRDHVRGNDDVTVVVARLRQARGAGAAGESR